ncbi:hypothetical protein [Vibrio harveyi]|uniref:hypothetical protein n=1 Tax=Vibrio harveyi TaxID=669 RepID=UPI0023804E72|nr:hypothetical protein [Vibrio harveyi]
MTNSVKRVDFTDEWRTKLSRAATIVAERDGQDGVAQELEQSIDSGRAFLFSAGKAGFFVLEPMTFEGKKAVNMTFCWSTERYGMIKYFPTVNSLAQKINAHYIIGYTKNEHLPEYYESIGFTPKGKNDSGLYVFVREVNYHERRRIE